MRVPPFDYPLENSLLRKVDIMIERCTQKNPKRDAVLLIEGAEGEGKTTYSIALGYYVALKTGREFDHTKVFFDLRKMIDFLKITDNQIAIWDEPALQAMSKDSLTTIVKDLERLLTMSRKKRHFVIINVSYFNMFNPYVVWQRPLGMIHVYSRREVEPGRFVYIRKKNLENLWHDWRTKRKRNYRKWCSKSVRGTFPDVLNPTYKNNVLSNFNLKYYEKEKDKAIASIGEDKEKKKDDLKELRFNVSQLPNRKKIAEVIGVSVRTLQRWAKKRPIHEEEEEIPKEIGV